MLSPAPPSARWRSQSDSWPELHSRSQSLSRVLELELDLGVEVDMERDESRASSSVSHVGDHIEHPRGAQPLRELFKARFAASLSSFVA